MNSFSLSVQYRRKTDDFCDDSHCSPILAWPDFYHLRLDSVSSPRRSINLPRASISMPLPVKDRGSTAPKTLTDFVSDGEIKAVVVADEISLTVGKANVVFHTRSNAKSRSSDHHRESFFVSSHHGCNKYPELRSHRRLDPPLREDSSSSNAPVSVETFLAFEAEFPPHLARLSSSEPLPVTFIVVPPQITTAGAAAFGQLLGRTRLSFMVFGPFNLKRLFVGRALIWGLSVNTGLRPSKFSLLLDWTRPRPTEIWSNSLSSLLDWLAHLVRECLVLNHHVSLFSSTLNLCRLFGIGGYPQILVRIISVLRFLHYVSGQAFAFQTATMRTLIGLLEVVSFWSSFGKCEATIGKHWIP